MFSNFDKKNMHSLWEDSTFWRVIINCLGAFSIIIGIWVIFRILKSILLNKKAQKIRDAKFINIKNLPSVFSSNSQICLVVNHEQNIQLSLLDENEKMVLSLYDDIIEKGDKIFHLNTTEHNNGTYYIAIKTPYQQILRKIKIEN